jgi:hypothetical protein
MARRAHIFIGPSGRGLEPLLDPARLVVHPPVRHGDLLRLELDRGDVVGIVDGLFYSVPAIRHGEILATMDRGATVVGGGSMGALRAADLSAVGMVGVGIVHEWLERGVIDADHEVALLHGDESTGYARQTVALVTLRYCLAGLVDVAVLDGRDAARIVEMVGSTWFGDRSLPAVERSCRAVGLDPQVTATVMDRLRGGPDVKVLDAAEVIRRCMVLADGAAARSDHGVVPVAGTVRGRRPAGPPGHRLDLHQLWTRELALAAAPSGELRRALAVQAIQLFYRDTPQLVGRLVRSTLASTWGVADDPAALAAAFTARTGLTEVSPAQRRTWLWPERGGTGDEDLVRLAVASYRAAPTLPAWGLLERHVGTVCDLEALGGAVARLIRSAPAPGADLPRILARVGLLWGCGPDAGALRRTGYARAFRDLGDVYQVARCVVGGEAEGSVRELVAGTLATGPRVDSVSDRAGTAA